MQVLQKSVIVIHVQHMICMVVVIGILTVHRQMLYLIDPLRHRHRAEHRHGLPQEDSQEDEGAKTTGHGVGF
jgi:hypothetical protein